MVLVAHSAELNTARAALIDPPLGMVTIDLGDDTISMAFSDGDIDEVPRSAVRAFERNENEVTAHWAGTPVVLAFESSMESARVFDELGGFDTDDRTFTFMVAEVNETEDRSKAVEPRLAKYVRRGAAGMIGAMALLAAFGLGANLGA